MPTVRRMRECAEGTDTSCNDGRCSEVSIHRRAARRDGNERPIIQALEQVGAVVEQMSRPCDLAVTFRFRHYLIEVDNPESKYRKRDEKQLETLERMRIPLVRTAEEALRVIGAM